MGFVQRRLIKGVMWVVSHPKVTLGVCAAVLVAAVVVALLGLKLSTDEDQLLTPKLGFFRDYKVFAEQFPENESFVILLEPKDYGQMPAAQRWVDYADRLAAGLMALKGDVVRVDTHVPPEEMGVQGLMFEEWPGVKGESEHVGDLVQLAKLMVDPSMLERLLGDNMTVRLLKGLGQDKAENGALLAQEAMGTLASAIESNRPVKEWGYGVEVPRMSAADPRGLEDPRIRGYNMIGNEAKRQDAKRYQKEKLLAIQIHTAQRYDSLSDVTRPMQRMKEVVAKVAPDFSEFKYPVITGRAAMSADQMETSDRDMRIAEVAGLSLVFMAMWAFLGVRSQRERGQFIGCAAGLAAVWVLYVMGVFGFDGLAAGTGICFGVVVLMQLWARDFGGLWMVVVAEVCLCVGIGWTFGWATVAVGRLNLLSLVFVIALIGIGMDYLIQIMVRYRYEKKRYGRPQAIWARVFRYVSPPISTACCGAAAAFFVAMLTNFHGAAELGLIAGGGLLLCLATGYTLMPAALTLLPASVGKVAESERYRHREEPPGAGGLRLAPAVMWVVLAVGGVMVAWPPRFDSNLINLQDDELPSVKEVSKLQTWSAVVLADSLGKLREVRAAILERKEDGAGEELTKLDLPKDEANGIGYTESLLNAEDKRKYLLGLNGGKVAVKWSEPAAPTAGQLLGIARAGRDLVAQWSEVRTGEKVVDISGVRLAAERLERAVANQSVPEEEKLARAGEWQRRFVQEVRTNVEQYAPGPLDVTKLPASLREHLMSGGPKPVYALYIYPRRDLWENGALKEFVEEVETRFAAYELGRAAAYFEEKDYVAAKMALGSVRAEVLPKGGGGRGDLRSRCEDLTKKVDGALGERAKEVGGDVVLTGIAPQVFHSTGEIADAFTMSTFYALGAIFVLMFLDLRSLRQTLLAISVLGLGLPMLLLAMHVWVVWLHEPAGILGTWNLANFFALPILIGAGHEYGVFMVHRYREALHDPRRVWRPWDVADRALLLCGIVTTSSFGFMLVARHHGLQSLGFVMAVGTACIYLSSLLVLRPVLTWTLKRKGVYGRNDEGRMTNDEINPKDAKSE